MGLVKTLEHNSLRFANPANWPDPLDCKVDCFWQLTSSIHIPAIAMAAAERIHKGVADIYKMRNTRGVFVLASVQ